MNIKTVRRAAWLLSYNDLSEDKKGDIDLPEEEDQSGAYFFFYQGIIYDTREFMRTETEG